jgi:hypothetical protein
MYRNSLPGWLLLCALWFAPAKVWAAHPLITDDTGTQGTGKYQLEAAGTWLTDKKNEGGEGVRDINSFGTVVITAGVAESLDVMVTVPYVWTETKESGTSTKSNGFSDTLMEAKWRFYEKQKLCLAIKPGILIPTGDTDKGLGNDHVGYSAFLISTIDTEPWAFDANLGYLYLPNSAKDRTTIWLGSLASRFAMAEQWKIVGEIGASRNTDSADSSYPVFAQIGLIYYPKDYLDLSAGYLVGLNNAAVDQSVRAGVTVRF